MDFYIDRTNENQRNKDFYVRAKHDRRSGMERREYTDQDRIGLDRRANIIDRRSGIDRRE